MLQTTSDYDLSAQVSRHKEDKDTIASASDTDGSASSGENIKNLLTAAKSAKSKKSKLTKTKKSDFAKANFSETDFFTPEAKKAFIHLQKAFTEALILRHFNPKRHIWIQTDVSEYAIGGILSHMTSDQFYSRYVTYKDPNSSKSKFSKWYQITFFSRKMILAKTRYETHDQELLAII